MTAAEITAAKIAFADRILADLDHADPKFWAGEYGLLPAVPVEVAVVIETEEDEA